MIPYIVEWFDTAYRTHVEEINMESKDELKATFILKRKYKKRFYKIKEIKEDL